MGGWVVGYTFLRVEYMGYTGYTVYTGYTGLTGSKW